MEYHFERQTNPETNIIKNCMDESSMQKYHLISAGSIRISCLNHSRVVQDLLNGKSLQYPSQDPGQTNIATSCIILHKIYANISSNKLIWQ